MIFCLSCRFILGFSSCIHCVSSLSKVSFLCYCILLYVQCSCMLVVLVKLVVSTCQVIGYRKTPLMTPLWGEDIIKRIYQVWRKSQITVGLKQDSSLRVFARVERQNDRRVTWIIRYYSVQSSSKKIPTTSYTHCSLPPKAPGYNLRKRSHGLLLPTTQSNLLRKNFVYRMLFKDIY